MPAYNFDQTVEAVLRMNVDTRKADQLVRGSVNLPNGTGTTATVLVFARGPVATGALDAGAGVATPDRMGKVGRLGRVLGPRGLSQNRKTGTVSMDFTKAM